MAKYIVVDVESDGELLGENSMVCFGAVLLDKEGRLDKTFYGKTKPISDKWKPEALAVSGFTRKIHETFDEPKQVMLDFETWLKEVCGESKPVLISDNNGYDASWINYYFHRYLGRNYFGWSSRRIGDLFCGFYNDPYYKWKKHRDNEKYPHNHNPLSDALGNASALLWLKEQGFKLKL